MVEKLEIVEVSSKKFSNSKIFGVPPPSTDHTILLQPLNKNYLVLEFLNEMVERPSIGLVIIWHTMLST